MSLDTLGNVYLTGYFEDTVDFDPNADEFNISALGYRELFVSKLDTDGNLVWAKNMGGVGADLRGNDLVVDEAGNIFVTGFFIGSVDFDPDAGSSILETQIPNRAIFILKLNPSGGYIWAQAIGESEIGGGAGITLDEDNNVYTIGSFQGAADFDSGVDSFILTTLSSEDLNVFISKMDSAGMLIWAVSFEGNDIDVGRDIAVDHSNNIYATGIFRDTTDFDPSTGTQELISDGFPDVFLLKMIQSICSASLNINSTDSDLSICKGDTIALTAELSSGISGLNYLWNTNDTTSSILVAPDSTSHFNLMANYLSDTTTCTLSTSVMVTVYDDPVIATTANKELCLGEVAILEASGGASYLWSTGDTISLIEITAEIDQTYSVSVTDSNGCFGVDSTSILVNVLSDTTHLDLSSCDSMMVGVSGFTYFDQNGCDSIVIETTSLIPLPEMPVVPADLIIQENASAFQLTVPEIPNATSYSWQVPTGVQILSGANTNTITIDWDDQVISGSVCVSALNECGSSPADCMEVTVDIIDAVKNIKNKAYSIFPNPTDALLNIVFDDSDFYEIELLDVLGRTVIPSSSYTLQAKIETGELASGTYWVKISNAGEAFWERVEVLR